jgi:hypothetical protein
MALCWKLVDKGSFNFFFFTSLEVRVPWYGQDGSNSQKQLSYRCYYEDRNTFRPMYAGTYWVTVPTG